MPETLKGKQSPGALRLQRVLFALAMLLLIFTSTALLWQQTRPQPLEIRVIPPPPTFTPTPRPTSGPLTVYVSGAVNAPQVLRLPPDSRVRDAIAAAGGALADADLALVNLAAPLQDGIQVHVAQLAVATPLLATGSALLRINQADAEALERLPGVGPVLAQRIIEWREANGPFADLADLDKVDGVGPALLRDLEALLRFD